MIFDVVVIGDVLQLVAAQAWLIAKLVLRGFGINVHAEITHQFEIGMSAMVR